MTFENIFDTKNLSTKAEVEPYPEPKVPKGKGYVVAVVGSRGYDDIPRLLHTLEQFHEKYTIKMVVSGGAKGADELGEAWALANDIPTHIHLARWGEGDLSRQGAYGAYNPRAGIIRNEFIVRDADIVLAFCTDWSKSKGTANTITQAKKAKKPTFIFDGKQGQYFTNEAAQKFVADNK